MPKTPVGTFFVPRLGRLHGIPGLHRGILALKEVFYILLGFFSRR